MSPVGFDRRSNHERSSDLIDYEGKRLLCRVVERTTTRRCHPAAGLSFQSGGVEGAFSYLWLKGIFISLVENLGG